MIAEPPFAGAPHETVSLAVAAVPCGDAPPTAAVVTVGAAGAAGFVVTVTDEDADEYAESPLAFVALT